MRAAITAPPVPHKWKERDPNVVQPKARCHRGEHALPRGRIAPTKPGGVEAGCQEAPDIAMGEWAQGTSRGNYGRGWPAQNRSRA